MIIDDVLSAGTAGRESIEAILKLSATPYSFIVGLDRQERGLSEISASKELEQLHESRRIKESNNIN